MSKRPVTFELLGKSSTTSARRGRLHTLRGPVETPVFMPVGTVGCVKALDPRDLSDIGARIILGNTYHLMLRPGDDLVGKLGGLRKFVSYDGAILTDSGGFQVFSLEGLRKVSDGGVSFRSHIDGSLHALSPERAVQIQENLASDIAMVLDECPPAKASREHVERAVARTTLWAGRCLEARTREDVAWFGIVQGALFEDIRTAHAATLAAMPFDGYAIGGVSVGEDPQDMDRIVRATAPALPTDKPRYLMGVGTPADLVRGVAAGVDMFDCVMPTRNARNGQLFTSTGRLNIKNAQHRDSEQPLDDACRCYTCRTFSRAYLRHLYVAGEITYHRLATLHNLTYYADLMSALREAIADDCFEEAQFLARWGSLAPAP